MHSVRFQHPLFNRKLFSVENMPIVCRFAMAGSMSDMRLDMLDCPSDEPRPDETLIAGILQDPIRVHIRTAGVHSVWTTTQVYVPLAFQPMQAVMKDNAMWAEWLAGFMEERSKQHLVSVTP